MFLFNSNSKKIAARGHAGFTLIELVVVVTIMLIMTGVVFFNYNNFNDTMLLTNSAYDLSLSIRQAQIYGVSVKEAPGTTVARSIDNNSHGNFTSAYGVHFDDSLPTSAQNFNLFVDSSGGAEGLPDGVYESGSGPGSDIVLQTYAFQRGINIKKMCVSSVGASGVDDCTPTSGNPTPTVVTSLDITFLRPNQQAKIYASGDSTTAYGSATIVLQNANGSVSREVVVSSTGQISVKSGS